MYYHLPIDWRRAKFYLNNRSVLPEYNPEYSSTIPPFTTFLAAEYISDIVPIRNWLYHKTIGYHLLGRYDRWPNFFRGIVFAFHDLCDLWQFRQHWISRCDGSAAQR